MEQWYLQWTQSVPNDNYAMDMLSALATHLQTAPLPMSSEAVLVQLEHQYGQFVDQSVRSVLKPNHQDVSDARLGTEHPDADDGLLFDHDQELDEETRIRLNNGYGSMDCNSSDYSLDDSVSSSFDSVLGRFGTTLKVGGGISVKVILNYAGQLMLQTLGQSTLEYDDDTLLAKISSSSSSPNKVIALPDDLIKLELGPNAQLDLTLDDDQEAETSVLYLHQHLYKYLNRRLEIQLAENAHLRMPSLPEHQLVGVLQHGSSLVGGLMDYRQHCTFRELDFQLFGNSKAEGLCARLQLKVVDRSYLASCSLKTNPYCSVTKYTCAGLQEFQLCRGAHKCQQVHHRNASLIVTPVKGDSSSSSASSSAENSPLRSPMRIEKVPRTRINKVPRAQYGGKAPRPIMLQLQRPAADHSQKPNKLPKSN